MLIRLSPDRILHWTGGSARTAIGRSGLLPEDQKREGDGATPIGTYPLRRVFFRPDRVDRPQTGLPVTPLSQDDGWCDAPGDPAYNRPVKLPYAASAEQLWREDHVYNIIVEIGHNDDPVADGLGSAVFIHLAHTDYQPTEGCIALARVT